MSESEPTEPRLNTLFRVKTMLALKEGKLSGYDIATKLMDPKTKERPSTGKIYPFLKQLKEANYIEESDIEDDTERSKTVYELTNKGHRLVEELLDRMGSIIDARLEQMLDTCKSCGVKIFETSVEGVDENGIAVKYCCTHCRDNYYSSQNISVD